MTAPTGPQRKRGVRASRARLAHALAEAGLKTQIALAERIADIEDLDSVPRDVVNRVFRELPVDPTTIERIARALDVEAHTLYKTAGEDELPAEPQEPASVPPVRRSPLVAVALATAALGLALAIRAWYAGAVPPSGPAAANVPAALDMGMPSLAVVPFEGDPGNAFSNSLRRELRADFNVARPTAEALTVSRDAGEIEQRLRTDAVVEGEFKAVGRLVALRVYLYRNGVRRQIWADSVPAAALHESPAALATRAATAVRRAVGLPVPEMSAAYFPLASVQDYYLEGEYYLDQPSNELNIKRAQSRFEAALRQDANYARAHAGLCQTLLEEYWMDSEERALKDAALACGQAVQLDPDDRVVRAAHAHFLARTGRNGEAIDLYRAIIDEHPRDAAALSALSSSLLEAYRSSGDEALLARAKSTARQAANVDEFVWKPLFSLATMNWFEGDVDGAIAASEEALARNENEYVLANLGSFYLCGGDLEQAKDAYARARELNPASYVGDEFLGQAHYFLGNFERSAELRQKAIDSVANGNPEIHEMWGNLGDSYRQTGDTRRAIDAYVRAAEIAERDYLRGTAPVADQSARAYYYTMLAMLDPNTVPDSVLKTIDDEIDQIAEQLVSASALRRLAQTYLARNEPEKAVAALDRAVESCPGYAKLPDLAALAGTTAVSR